MTVNFTDKEMKYIDQKRFHWAIKNDCPESTRKSIEKKLQYLYGKKYDQKVVK
jgi:hypothetical protein